MSARFQMTEKIPNKGRILVIDTCKAFYNNRYETGTWYENREDQSISDIIPLTCAYTPEGAVSNHHEAVADAHARIRKEDEAYAVAKARIQAGESVWQSECSMLTREQAEQRSRSNTLALDLLLIG